MKRLILALVLTLSLTFSVGGARIVSAEWGDGDDGGGCCYQDFGPIPCSAEDPW